MKPPTSDVCVFIFPAFPLFVLYGLGQAAWGCSLFQTNHEWVCPKKRRWCSSVVTFPCWIVHPKDLETERSHVSFIHTGWWCNNHLEKYERIIPYMKWKIKTNPIILVPSQPKHVLLCKKTYKSASKPMDTLGAATCRKESWSH